MLLILSFLRDKKTKIYIIIFLIILTIITLLLYGIEILNNKINSIYQNNSYYLTFNLDINDSSYEEVTNIRKYIILELDSVNILDDSFNKNVLTDQNNSFILISSKEDLDDNQIYIETPYIDFINDIPNSKININYENINTDFLVVNAKASNFARLYLSNEMFNYLSSDTNQVYTFNLIDYFERDKILINLEDSYGIKANFVQYYGNTKQMDTLNTLEKILKIINIIIYTLIILFLIIFVITIKNIVSDEVFKMELEHYLGYSSKKIRILLFCKIIIINIIVWGFINVFNFFIYLGSKLFYQELSFINISYINLALLFISIFICLVQRIEYTRI